MGRYRSRPVEIEAVQVPASMNERDFPHTKIGVLLGPNGPWRFTGDGGIEIEIAGGMNAAAPGDWIVAADGGFCIYDPLTFARLYQPADVATAISHNQIVTPAQLPGRDEHTLERLDDAEAKDYAGPPVTIAPYRRPADKRVKTLLDDAARNRAADALREEPAPRKVLFDPRLDPNYKPPKKPTR